MQKSASPDIMFIDTTQIATIQSLSGTGALLLAGLALKRANNEISTVYITTPTWQNQELLFGSMGFEIKQLPYYNEKQRAFDCHAFLEALRQLDGPRSAVIFHACAHNPTGCDPSREQWEAIADVVQEKGIFPIFDSAYLGFNSGSVNEDTWAIRLFVEERRLEAAVCVSFAKNMGLYGERVGLSAFVVGDKQTARICETLLENAQRSTVSVPPAYGARIAALVMGSPEIRAQWEKDLITMSSRIRDMREKLYGELIRLETPGSWTHLVRQSGMFGFTGISRQQVQALEAKHHIYMAETSRISVAGLNDGNVAYFAQALDDVVRHVV
jgi:aspartate aminotransferase, cytoplasmic